MDSSTIRRRNSPSCRRRTRRVLIRRKWRSETGRRGFFGGEGVSGDYGTEKTRECLTVSSASTCVSDHNVTSCSYILRFVAQSSGQTVYRVSVKRNTQHHGVAKVVGAQRKKSGESRKTCRKKTQDTKPVI